MHREFKRRVAIHIGGLAEKDVLEYSTSSPLSWREVLQLLIPLHPSSRSEDLLLNFTVFFREGSCSSPATCPRGGECYRGDPCFRIEETFVEIEEGEFNPRVTDILLVPIRNFRHYYSQAAVAQLDRFSQKVAEFKNSRLLELCQASALLITSKPQALPVPGAFPSNSTCLSLDVQTLRESTPSPFRVLLESTLERSRGYRLLTCTMEGEALPALLRRKPKIVFFERAHPDLKSLRGSLSQESILFYPYTDDLPEGLHLLGADTILCFSTQTCWSSKCQLDFLEGLLLHEPRFLHIFLSNKLKNACCSCLHDHSLHCPWSASEPFLLDCPCHPLALHQGLMHLPECPEINRPPTGSQMELSLEAGKPGPEFRVVRVDGKLWWSLCTCDVRERTFAFMLWTRRGGTFEKLLFYD